MLDEMFDLGKADEIRDLSGAYLSFHNTMRLPGNCLATTVVLRPTQRTDEILRSAIGDEMPHVGWLPLELHLYGPRGTPERPAIVAELRERAMHVMWLVFPAETHGEQRDVGFWLHVYDRSPGAKLSKRAGIPVEDPVPHVEVGQRLRLQDYPERDVLSTANAIYDQVEQLASFRPMCLIVGYGDPLTDWHRAAHAQGCGGGLSLRATRTDFCDAFVKAWTPGN
jgi:hypothetical protein